MFCKVAATFFLRAYKMTLKNELGNNHGKSIPISLYFIICYAFRRIFFSFRDF